MGQKPTKPQENVQVETYDPEAELVNRLFSNILSTHTVTVNNYSPIREHSDEKLKDRRQTIYNPTSCSPTSEITRYEAINRGIEFDQKTVCKNLNNLIPKRYWDEIENYMFLNTVKDAALYYMKNNEFVDQQIRGGITIDSDLMKSVSELSKFIDDAPRLENDLILYRSPHKINALDYHSLYRSGKRSIEDSTFFSASLYPQIDENDSFVLRIRIPKGTKALFMEEYRNEFLFQLDNRLTFTGMTKASVYDGGNIVDIDVIDFDISFRM